MTTQEWFNNPDRTFAEGLEIYKSVKKSNKFDAFFAQGEASKQGELHFNILEQELRRLTRINIQSEKPKQQTLPIIEVKKVIAPVVAPAAGKNEKPKFFDETRYNFNELSAEMKKLFTENQELTKQMSPFHEQMKAVPEGKENDAKRAELRQNLAKLETKRNKNWSKIDKWWNTDRNNVDAGKTKEVTPLSAVELGKKIDTAKRYIARYSKSEDAKQIAECKVREKFLNDNGIVIAKKKKE